ncbi:hypothetical protein DINM_020147 [Dirofilaria immitis]|nr:hypothetical protein [Dirofilaria immitis]
MLQFCDYRETVRAHRHNGKMLPSAVEKLKDERSKDNDEASYPVVNLLWQFSLRTGISRHILPAFKIIIVLGGSITLLLYYLSLNWTVFVEDRSYGIAAVQGQQVRYLIESRPCLDVKKICYTVYDAVDMFTGDVNRFWSYNMFKRNKKLLQYVAVMLTVPFGVAALIRPNYANLVANVLIVGLGGGNMNMFLTNHFPKITITVVELDEVVVDLAWRIVVLNILPAENAFDQVDQVVRVYQKQFPTCAVAPLHHEMNTILACQILQQLDTHSSQRLLSQRFQEAWNHFGFIQQFGVMELSFIGGKIRT